MKSASTRPKSPANAAAKFNAISPEEPVKYRTLRNFIIEGKYIPLDTVIEDITIIPPDLREFVIPDSPDLDEVKLLVGISYLEDTQVRGEVVGIQVNRPAGTVLKLSSIPERTRNTLQENIHYSRDLEAEPEDGQGQTPQEQDFRQQTENLHYQEYQ